MHKGLMCMETALFWISIHLNGSSSAAKCSPEVPNLDAAMFIFSYKIYKKKHMYYMHYTFEITHFFS